MAMADGYEYTKRWALFYVHVAQGLNASSISNVMISESTILCCRSRRQLGWTYCGGAYCQLIRECNKAIRLTWCVENQNDGIIWTDETTTQLENHRRFSHSVNHVCACTGKHLCSLQLQFRYGAHTCPVHMLLTFHPQVTATHMYCHVHTLHAQVATMSGHLQV